MQSRYRDDDAARFVADHPSVPESLALRTYTARLLGADGALVLHGGGNTSVKAKAKTLAHGEVDAIYVKGSGWDLATIEPPGHPAVRLAPLLDLRALSSMTDEAMVNELRINLLDASAPTPSVETLLHAFLPARFIDHTHADAVLAVCDQPDGESVCRRIFGDGLVWVPYVMPGFTLALRCADAFDAAVRAKKSPSVIVLERHGIFTFGDTAKESYTRMIESVTLAERAIASAKQSVAASEHPKPATVSATVLSHALRGTLAKLAGKATERAPIVHHRTSNAILSFLARPDAEELTRIGCATPDHVIRTKPAPLFVRLPGAHESTSLSKTLEAQIVSYARVYDAYFHEMCAEKNVRKTKLDPWPRVVLAPGLGVFTVGSTLAEARIAADVYEHTVEVIRNASDVGRYAPVSRSDLFDVEYWSLEQAKLKKSAARPLAEAIALVTGAGSGIGRATASRLLASGAHVVLVDRSPEGIQSFVQHLKGEEGSRATSFVADVTSEAEVRAAFAFATESFGGVDIVVSNAGNAPTGDLHDDAGDERLRASLELNLLSHNLVARAAVSIFRAQGNGGCLLFNVSKAAFAPGPHFGPYAVAKAGLLALMRQYAIDAAPFGVRSNGINADRIRTALFDDGVAESRAAARGLTVDAYFTANMLGREVEGDDVADAFVYLASARATTGCVVTVDGGNPAAFPR